ncbi:arginine/ornithine succinyltransferase subunit alpha, partial [Burkholderia pseudomallei]
GADAPLPADARAALGVADGDTVRCVPLHQRDGQPTDQPGDAA